MKTKFVAVSAAALVYFGVAVFPLSADEVTEAGRLRRIENKLNRPPPSSKEEEPDDSVRLGTEGRRRFSPTGYSDEISDDCDGVVGCLLISRAPFMPRWTWE